MPRRTSGARTTRLLLLQGDSGGAPESHKSRTNGEFYGFLFSLFSRKWAASRNFLARG